jgi:hypothetical protein
MTTSKSLEVCDRPAPRLAAGTLRIITQATPVIHLFFWLVPTVSCYYLLLTMYPPTGFNRGSAVNAKIVALINKLPLAGLPACGNLPLHSTTFQPHSRWYTGRLLEDIIIMESPYLTQKETAGLIPVSPENLDRYVRAGLLTKYKTPGGANRFLRTEVLALIHGKREVGH